MVAIHKRIEGGWDWDCCPLIMFASTPMVTSYTIGVIENTLILGALWALMVDHNDDIIKRLPR